MSGLVALASSLVGYLSSGAEIDWSELIRLTQSEGFEKSSMFVVTFFGATAMYVFSLYKGFGGAKGFLKIFFPGRKALFYDRADFFVVTLFGAIIGTIVFSPSTALQALAAGFGWVGAMNVLLQADEKQADCRLTRSRPMPEAPN